MGRRWGRVIGAENKSNCIYSKNSLMFGGSVHSRQQGEWLAYEQAVFRWRFRFVRPGAAGEVYATGAVLSSHYWPLHRGGESGGRPTLLAASGPE